MLIPSNLGSAQSYIYNTKARDKGCYYYYSNSEVDGGSDLGPHPLVETTISFNGYIVSHYPFTKVEDYPSQSQVSMPHQCNNGLAAAFLQWLVILCVTRRSITTLHKS